MGIPGFPWASRGWGTCRPCWGNRPAHSRGTVRVGNINTFLIQTVRTPSSKPGWRKIINSYGSRECLRKRMTYQGWIQPTNQKHNYLTPMQLLSTPGWMRHFLISSYLDIFLAMWALSLFVLVCWFATVVCSSTSDFWRGSTKTIFFFYVRVVGGQISDIFVSKTGISFLTKWSNQTHI